MQCSYRILFLQRGHQFTESIASLELYKNFSGLLIRFIHLKTEKKEPNVLQLYIILFIYLLTANIY